MKMNKEQIKDIALANGFNLKAQPDGTTDLNPYVYDFAEKLIKQAQADGIMLLIDGCPWFVTDSAPAIFVEDIQEYAHKLRTQGG